MAEESPNQSHSAISPDTSHQPQNLPNDSAEQAVPVRKKRSKARIVLLILGVIVGLLAILIAAGLVREYLHQRNLYDTSYTFDITDDPRAWLDDGYSDGHTKTWTTDYPVEDLIGVTDDRATIVFSAEASGEDPFTDENGDNHWFAASGYDVKTGDQQWEIFGLDCSASRGVVGMDRLVSDRLVCFEYTEFPGLVNVFLVDATDGSKTEFYEEVPVSGLHDLGQFGDNQFAFIEGDGIYDIFIYPDDGETTSISVEGYIDRYRQVENYGIFETSTEQESKLIIFDFDKADFVYETTLKEGDLVTLYKDGFAIGPLPQMLAQESEDEFFDFNGKKQDIEAFSRSLVSPHNTRVVCSMADIETLQHKVASVNAAGKIVAVNTFDEMIFPQTEVLVSEEDQAEKWSDGMLDLITSNRSGNTFLIEQILPKKILLVNDTGAVIDKFEADDYVLSNGIIVLQQGHLGEKFTVVTP